MIGLGIAFMYSSEINNESRLQIMVSAEIVQKSSNNAWYRSSLGFVVLYNVRFASIRRVRVLTRSDTTVLCSFLTTYLTECVGSSC